MRILDWMPTPLNRLLGQHWGKANRCTRDDAAEIRIAMEQQHVPPATTKRRLTVLVVLPPKRRAPDPDALTKSLADALVHAGALHNDSHLWVEHGPVQFARGQRLTTYVTLETL
jgi:Holliday junction resolvase RusA-like endonuclease